jgi:putative transposase
VDQVKVHHRARLLRDNRPAYVSGELRLYLKERRLRHTRGCPYHPQTQGKIERWHLTMKNVVKLENDYFPGELKLALKDFVAYYNHERYHESLKNVKPADAYYAAASGSLKARKDQTQYDERTKEALSSHSGSLGCGQKLSLRKGCLESEKF